jgi:hypothetical protein
MALLTGLLSDLQVAFLDLDRFARGEVERMPEAVRGIRRVLAEEIRWRVAVVAGGYGAVRRLQPAVLLLVHNVAVGARRVIVHQVRRAFGVNERVDAQPDHHAYGNT